MTIDWTSLGLVAVTTVVAGYLCVGISALLVLYGLYLIIPQFH